MNLKNKESPLTWKAKNITELGWCSRLCAYHHRKFRKLRPATTVLEAAMEHVYMVECCPFVMHS